MVRVGGVRQFAIRRFNFRRIRENQSLIERTAIAILFSAFY